MFLKAQHWGQEKPKCIILRIINVSGHVSRLSSPINAIEGIQEGLDQILAQPHTYVTLGTLIKLSEPPFPHLEKGDY